MDRPLIFMTCAVALGMTVGALAGQAALWPAVVLIGICLAVVSKLGLAHPWFKYLLLMWVAALGLVWFLLNQNTNSLLLPEVGKKVELTGQITQVTTSGTRQVLMVKLLEAEGLKPQTPEYCQVYLEANQQKRYTYGQIIKLTGKPELIPEGGNPGTFSYRDYMSRKGVYTELFAWGAPTVVGQSGNWLGRLADGFRQNTHRLASSVMGQREEGIVRGILFGDTQDLSATDKDVFSTTGVLHAFAVSGANVAFVLFLGLVSFRFLPKPFQLALTALVIIFYTILTGGQGPVLRASIMALVLLGGYALNRRGEGLNFLALSALLMLAYNPRFLTDPGFQLSFAATWGLIELVPKLGFTRLHGAAREVVLFPIAAQLATLPLLAYYFNQISLVGVVANIAVTWFLALILEIGLAAAALGLLLPLLGQLLFAPLGYLTGLTVWLLELMAKVPGAALWVTKPSIILVIAYYAGLLLWFKRDWYLEHIPTGLSSSLKKLMKPATIGLVLLAVFLAEAAFASVNTQDLTVRFLDVGQGDSILITTPEGHNYLIDGGPRTVKFDSGKSIVVPYLLANGIKQLDGVFMTHPHDDHSGGLLEVVRTFPVKAFYRPPVTNNQESPGLWPELEKELIRRGVPDRQIQAGIAWELDKGVKLKVLSPRTMLEGSRSDFNNNCLVMSVSYGQQSLLLTGDIELEALAELRDYAGVNYTVVKVPHHGSKYGLDKSFWDNLNPKLAVISVGQNNFGQPTPEVLNYWKQRGIPVLRTDQDGQVDLETNGQQLKVYAGREKALRFAFNS